MIFSEFAQFLYSIVGGNKYEFTIELLKAGLNDQGKYYIKSLSNDASGKSRIRKYLSGENNITRIAPEIITYFDKCLFIDYIFEILDDNKFSEVCEKFNETFKSSIIPMADDLPQALTDIYIEILEQAAKGQKTIITNNTATNKADKIDPQNGTTITTSEHNTFYPVSISKFDIDTIQKLIIDLSFSIDKLLELGEQIGSKEREYGYNNAYDMLRDLYLQYKNTFSSFFDLRTRMNFYYRKYPHYLFERLVEVSDNLTKESFMTKYDKHWRRYVRPDDSVYDYKNLLAELSSELDKCNL